MKRVRQYIGILAPVAAYYSVHEGAHLLCAVFLGTFRQIRFMGIGMQVDVYAERMTCALTAAKQALQFLRKRLSTPWREMDPGRMYVHRE